MEKVAEKNPATTMALAYQVDLSLMAQQVVVICQPCRAVSLVTSGRRCIGVQSRSIYPANRSRLLTPRTTPTTTSLCEYAEAQGIAVVWAVDQPDQARWHEGVQIISVRHGMSERRTVSVIAHELGHWWHADWCSTGAGERRAWRFAGQLLVDPVEYVAAEQEHPSAGAIARTLGVLTDVIHGYRSTLQA